MNLDNLLRQFEMQDWNTFNQFTTSFLVFLGLAFIQAYGLIQQNHKLRKNRSGESISLIFFTCQFLFFFSFVIYGFSGGDIIIISNNLSCLFFLPVIYSLIKFKYLTVKVEQDKKIRTKLKKRFNLELILTILIASTFLPLIIFIEDKDLVIAFMLIPVGLSIFPQGYDVLIKKQIKNIELKYILAMLISSLLWIGYGIVSYNYVPVGWGFFLSSGITVFISSLFLQTYLRYKKAPCA